MSFLDRLDSAVATNNSLLCVGLDVDLGQIPASIKNQTDPLFIFCRQIIDATNDLVCAYKPNIAFFEQHGLAGLSALIKIMEYIKLTNIPVILDAKRGDIGHSSAAYAKSVFEIFKADAVTVSPYLGHDSVEPFLAYRDKGTFVLCLTSNVGAKDFQNASRTEPLYKEVAKQVKKWDQHHNCGLVVGATKPEELKEIRELVGDLPILIPGIGAQGGDLAAAVKYGTDQNGRRAIINVSRNVIYAADPRAEAKKIRDEINQARNC